MAKKDYERDPQEEKVSAEEKAKTITGNPPAMSESLGSPLPEPLKDDVANSEKARLDRIGVKSDDDQVRGQNIVAEGHHSPEPILEPHPEPTVAGEKAEYKLNNYGLTMPAEAGGKPTSISPLPVAGVPSVDPK